MTVLERIRSLFPHETPRAEAEASVVRLTVPLAKLVETCATVAGEPGARLMVMTGTDERANGEGFGLYYVFALDADGSYVSVETMVDPLHPSFPSVTPAVPAAHWYEREVKDLLGLDPQGHPDPRRLVLHDDWPRGLHPLRKDFALTTRPPRVGHPSGPITGVRGDGVMEVPVGPIHAGIIEPGHFRFGAVGELVLQLEARLFYTHRGIEKAAEGRSVQRVLHLAERICGTCSLSHAVAFSQAIERLVEVTPPRRAALVRGVLLELERLYNHVGDLANLCAGASVQLGVHQGGVLKERLQELNARVGGHRFLFGVSEPGGVRVDLTRDAVADLRRTLAPLEVELRSYVDALLETESFLERLTATGVLATDIAAELGAVGVTARASGVVRDVRATHPYAPYTAGLVTPVVRRQGDVRARFLVRVEEAFASFRLIDGFLDELGAVEAGALTVAIPPLPPRRWAMGVVESPRGENVHWVMTDAHGAIARYRVRSASYNWALVPFAVPGNMLPDFPLINKSFELCYACLDR